MGSRGKQSAGLGVVPISGARIDVPGHLTEAEASEWRAIVGSLPADWFRPGDIPLLGAYCVAAAFYKEAVEMMRRDGLVITDDKGTMRAHPAKDILTSQASAMAQLAVKLRLCPSARMTEGKASTKTAKTSAKPWEAAG